MNKQIHEETNDLCIYISVHKCVCVCVHVCVCDCMCVSVGFCLSLPPPLSNFSIYNYHTHLLTIIIHTTCFG